MDKITSTLNPLVKETVRLQQKKYREMTGRFLLEGAKPVTEALAYGIQIENIFVREDKLAEYKFPQTKIILTNAAVLKKISTTESAPDCVAVGVQKSFTLSDAEKYGKVLLSN